MPMPRKVCLLAILLTVTLTPVDMHAEPAAWYKWRSKLNTHVVCSQTWPGEGWEQMTTAYRDARCEKPKKN
ncbi:hypothetical protein ACO0K9_18335 [Undibacterium sp. Ji50W]|uniref:hypothetical protein n=1 Tax=Undibacterium sp. Ji50W TaxID=3413041 RepID=UPI003BEFBD34